MANTRYVRVEYDRGYYDGEGEFVLLSMEECAKEGGVERAFERKTGLNEMRIVHYSPDELYDEDGELVDDPPPDEPSDEDGDLVEDDHQERGELSFKSEALAMLKALYEKCEALREELDIEGAPGEDLWYGETDDKKIIVTADGLGGATLMIAGGNCHTECLVEEMRRFDDCRTLVGSRGSDAACAAAHRLIQAWQGEENDEGVKEDYQDVKAEVFAKEKA